MHTRWHKKPPKKHLYPQRQSLQRLKGDRNTRRNYLRSLQPFPCTSALRQAIWSTGGGSCLLPVVPSRVPRDPRPLRVIRLSLQPICIVFYGYRYSSILHACLVIGVLYFSLLIVFPWGRHRICRLLVCICDILLLFPIWCWWSQLLRPFCSIHSQLVWCFFSGFDFQVCSVGIVSFFKCSVCTSCVRLCFVAVSFDGCFVYQCAGL